MVTKANIKEIWRNYETWPSLCSLQDYIMNRKKSSLGNPTALDSPRRGQREEQNDAEESRYWGSR